MSTVHVSNIRASLARAPATFLQLMAELPWITTIQLRHALADMLYAGEIELAQHKALQGRFGFALLDRDDRAQISFATLQGAMLLALWVHGPLNTEDLRERVCCASRLKFMAALSRLIQAGEVVRGHSAVKLLGDERPWPEAGSINGKYQRRARERRERMAATDRDLGAELVEEALGGVL